jgi:hypothetical protein
MSESKVARSERFRALAKKRWAEHNAKKAQVAEAERVAALPPSSSAAVRSRADSPSSRDSPPAKKPSRLSNNLLLLIAVIGAFALAGLYLLTRPKHSGGANNPSLTPPTQDSKAAEGAPPVPTEPLTYSISSNSTQLLAIKPGKLVNVSIVIPPAVSTAGLSLNIISAEGTTVAILGPWDNAGIAKVQYAPAGQFVFSDPSATYPLKVTFNIQTPKPIDYASLVLRFDWSFTLAGAAGTGDTVVTVVGNGGAGVVNKIAIGAAASITVPAGVKWTVLSAALVMQYSTGVTDQPVTVVCRGGASYVELQTEALCGATAPTAYSATTKYGYIGNVEGQYNPYSGDDSGGPVTWEALDKWDEFPTLLGGDTLTIGSSVYPDITNGTQLSITVYQEPL